MIGSKFSKLTIALAVGAFSGAVAMATPVLADSTDLSGNWSGGGSVNYNTGSKEKARCRAQFSKIGSTSYSMNATCATASGKVSQSATLRKTGSNSYAGSFRNPEYNVTGSINVRINGKSQSVSMSSDSGSANFNLSKL
jgi:hypothetical protein